MCVNKRQEYLQIAIESVLNQDDPEFDFYIIANNCTEDLWNFLSNISDTRLKLHRTAIGQLCFNLNYGLNLISTGYALRMDADDICLPNRLTLTKQYLEKHDWPDIVGGQAILIDEAGRETGQTKPPSTNAEIRACLWRKNPLIHPSCALKVETIFGLRGYCGGFMSEDYDLWLRAARDKRIVFGNIDSPLIKYRVHGDQARGNPLGYSEVAGHMLREALLGMGLRYYFGAVVGVFKRFIRAKF